MQVKRGGDRFLGHAVHYANGLRLLFCRFTKVGVGVRCEEFFTAETPFRSEVREFAV
jgi:hypothetical protein